jgi:hypothetical protein
MQETPQARAAALPTALAQLDGILVLRIGLAMLFIANAAVAWIEPEQFTTLVVQSGFDFFIDPDLVVWAIRANDVAIGIALLVAWNRWQTLIAAWAGLYLLSVAIIKLAALA